ncbi:MAG: hypothetical protein ABL921_08345 [Pirellula sp.]
MFRSNAYTVYLSIVAFFGMTEAVQSRQWSDLVLNVQWDSKVLPTPVGRPRIGIPGGVPIVDETLVVDPISNAIQNVVLMIDERFNKFDRKAIHPELVAAPVSPAILDMIQFRFEPHVLSIRANQILRVRKRDGRNYNPKFNFIANDETNLKFINANISELLLKHAERTPAPVACNIHPWMSAFVLVTDHPYVGISDVEGKIKIEKLPAGISITFRIWHESQDKSIEEVRSANTACCLRVRRRRPFTSIISFHD